jgi:predicted protein tyrosine phosphatase
MLHQNLLFVCSRNKRRSLTAEMIFRKNEAFTVKSCGTSPQARVTINAKMIRWADVILVMEKRHRDIIVEQFETELHGKIIKVLHIPDEFEYMDDALVEILEERLTFHL